MFFCTQLAWNKLGWEKKFDLSLFERLIKNGYPHTLLLRQSRMHPSLVPLHAYHYQTRDSNIKSVEVSYMIIMFVVCMMCTVFVLQIENRVLEET